MNFFSGAPVADGDSYDRALERKREILARLESLRAELKAVDEFIALHERIFGGESVNTLANPPGRRRSRNLLPPHSLVQLAQEILREAGHPLTRSAIAKEIERRGIPLAGTDPVKNLGTILWRSTDRIVSVPGRGYWIAGSPVPPTTG